jgi:glutamyl-tRNA(Gln) amidotransferase subunit E
MASPLEFDPTGQILDIDYADLGFRCGLEVHYQLATEHKLFCHCPVGLYSEDVDAEVLRHMRPTLSELGEYDPCALMEFKTRKEIIYLLNKDSVCTYEMDDTPPFPINQQAVDFALEGAMLLNCKLVDELHIARKQYLDGSIPTGFQRTTLVGVNGYLPYRNREIGIIQLGLEEDSCREVKDQRHTIWFRTDRLGTPLIEVVTRPEMYHPFEVAEVGRLIAHTLRLTNKVRRGLGTVRQDVNVSITGGTRVEIKGVPRIPLFPRLVSFEAYRQKRLLELRDELHRRGITASTLEYSTCELPSEKIHFRTAKLAHAHEHGLRVAALRIAGITGLTTWEVQPGRTFTHEISGRVRVIACLDDTPNLFHTDPDGEFHLFPEEQTAVRVFSGAHPNDVVFVFWGPEEDVTTAMNETVSRIREATIGIPPETRQARRGGWTDFERLLAGPDRMYPDTDSPPTVITHERATRIRAQLPESPWNRRARLLKTGMSDSLAEQMMDSPHFDLFGLVMADGPLPGSRVARVFVQDVPAARRLGGHPERIADEAWRKLFDYLRAGDLRWEAVPALIRIRSRRPGSDWLSIASKQRMTPLADAEWTQMVESALKLTPRSRKPEAHVRWLLGLLQRPPGRIPAREAAEWLKSRIAKDEH